MFLSAHVRLRNHLLKVPGKLIHSMDYAHFLAESLSRRDLHFFFGISQNKLKGWINPSNIRLFSGL